MHKGSCLCGAVTFEIAQVTGQVLACHCIQCRKFSGHFFATSRVDNINFRLTCDDGLRWHESSPGIKRGFCGTCGSSLFWQPDGRPSVSVAAGSIDGLTGLKIVQHWYVANKGDYYDIVDGAKQQQGYDNG